MALQPIPLKLCCYSSPHFIVLQPQSRTAVKFRVSCSNQTAQFDTQPGKAKTTTKKKKSSSRPSFFHQIQDKWSQKLGSDREKFPWQEPHQEEVEEQDDEEEEEEKEKEERVHKSSALNFQFPKRLSPWPQAGSPINSKFDFETESDAAAGDNVKAKPLKRSVGGSVIGRKGIVKRSSSYREEKSENKSSELNFQFPKRLSPWPQAGNPTNSKFDFETESDAAGDNGKPLQRGFGGSVVQIKGIVNESSTSREEKRIVLNDLASKSVRKGRSNSEVAEKSIPEHELRRLRNVALRMMERFQVGVAGITQKLVDSIHEKWRHNEVVKLKFGSPLSANMRRAHHLLESRTGGLVVWRSGSSVVLYRGMTYKLPCVELYTKMNHAKENTVQPSVHVGNGSDGQVSVKEPATAIRDSAGYLKDMTEEELMELNDLNNLLDELGPRYKDWTGREPLPIDADLLPAVVPGYKTPFRLLPYGVRHCLSNKATTNLRRLARSTAPQFALGRSRELQGLASAMVKLWETSAIAKIAIKRGVAHTRNERMAEELRKLTGGTLLSRNKEYIVFYRGNDFLPPAVTNVLIERKKLTLLQQDEEEKARQIASSITGLNPKLSKAPLVAGTLAETKAATTNWGHQPSREEVEKMMRDKALDRLTSFIRNLEKRLELAKAKFRKAEKAIAKLQGNLEPADLPTDLETLTNEERFLFRKIGLSMKPYLLLGKRAVYAGTIENMHLHWKYRELVKIIAKGKTLAQVKHIAISLEAESGGVLVSLDKDNKDYIIIVYRGKNYFRPRALRPKNLLTRRKALARSIELQRREALKHHISDLKERIELLKSELEDMKNGKEIDVDETLYSTLDDPVLPDDDLEESEETEIYFDEDDSGGEDEKIQNKQLDTGALLPAIPPIVETLHGESSGSNAPSLLSDPEGRVISPPPSNLPVHPSPSETPGPSHPKESRGNIAPSSPAVQNGSFLNPPNTLPPPALAPTPPKIKDTEPSISPSPSSIVLSPPHEFVPSPSTVQGNVPPSVKSSPPQREEPAVRPPVPTPTAPAPVAIHSGGWQKISPVSQPSESGTLAPNVDNRNANMSHTAVPVSPTPVATPTNFANNSSGSPPTEHVTFPPKEGTSKGHIPEPTSPAPVAVHLPKFSPVQPTEHGSLPPIVHQRNASTGDRVSPATVAIPPATIEKNSTVSQPTQHGSVPPNVHQGTANKGHNPETVSPESVAPPPWKVEHKPPVAHPTFPTITPSILPAPVTSPATSPTSAFPVNQPLVHPIIPAVSPSKLPVPVASPMSSPSRSFNWTKGRPPVAAPLYKKLKPLPAVIHSPAQDQAIPPSLPPKSGRRHHVPKPINLGSSVSPLFSPIHSPMSQDLPASLPSIKYVPHPTKRPFPPPKVSPVWSSSKTPKTPLLPQVQALPPPPPNQDCLSTVCSEPYTNSPPGAPCRCVWPMQVGLRLGVSLYTFFPLVTELASEIASGVFMKQSQVRIMGANAANQQPEKTVVLIDLVPLREKFDDTTASFTSDRFWHKQVVIKASYFGEYDVLYVNYPGLPPSPPLPPSSITVIDGGPYSGNGNNGRAIKPLGVDIQKRQHKGGLSRGIIAIVAVSIFLAVILCIAAAWVMIKFRDHVSQPASAPQVSQPFLAKAPGTTASLIGGGVGSTSTSFRSSIAAYAASAKTFSMNDIEKATDNFHAARILGEGGFGRVYSGILEDGTKVAVKVLKREDHHADREFLAEVEMLSRLHHRNLVKLIGICTEDTFRCLVYELVPNDSVESHLHGVDRENSPLDWGTRMKIALGAARGLAYLHEDSSPRVIHRDFKSSNILLEDDFTPKVSDFGLARTAMEGENRHISTRVMGTFGYVAPEYAMTGHLLVKSDVYSYGVVLLELLTRRKPVDMSQPPGQENLVAWARPLLTSNVGLQTIIDPSLGADVPIDSVAKVAAIASMCVQPEVSNRPFMGEVVQALKLVCSECDEAKDEAGLRSCSQEDLFVDLDVGISPPSGQLEDNLGRQFSATNFDSGLDIERGLSASELFNSSARYGRLESESFRRHSYSGPLRTGRSRQLWQIIRTLSGGTVSDHGTMFNL